ncbi:hypothetical protein [Sporanaerobacter acetigenes]|nr:hypothetical protein [Sporanaerobacter acetigenes]
MNREGMMQLQHFAEKGLLPDEWDDVKLESLVITVYEQAEGEIIPNIDKEKDLSVVLHIDENIEEIPIRCPFTVEFDKQDIGSKVVYYAPILEKEKNFFINEIYSFKEDWEDYLIENADIKLDKQICKDVVIQLDEYFNKKKKIFNYPCLLKAQNLELRFGMY